MASKIPISWSGARINDMYKFVEALNEERSKHSTETPSPTPAQLLTYMIAGKTPEEAAKMKAAFKMLDAAGLASATKEEFKNEMTALQPDVVAAQATAEKERNDAKTKLDQAKDNYFATRRQLRRGKFLSGLFKVLRVVWPVVAIVAGIALLGPLGAAIGAATSAGAAIGFAVLVGFAGAGLYNFIKKQIYKIDARANAMIEDAQKTIEKDRSDYEDALQQYQEKEAANQEALERESTLASSLAEMTVTDADRAAAKKDAVYLRLEADRVCMPSATTSDPAQEAAYQAAEADFLRRIDSCQTMAEIEEARRLFHEATNGIATNCEMAALADIGAEIPRIDTTAYADPEEAAATATLASQQTYISKLTSGGPFDRSVFDQVSGAGALADKHLSPSGATEADIEAAARSSISGLPTSSELDGYISDQVDGMFIPKFDCGSTHTRDGIKTGVYGDLTAAGSTRPALTVERDASGKVVRCEGVDTIMRRKAAEHPTISATTTMAMVEHSREIFGVCSCATEAYLREPGGVESVVVEQSGKRARITSCRLTPTAQNMLTDVNHAVGNQASDPRFMLEARLRAKFDPQTVPKDKQSQYRTIIRRAVDGSISEAQAEAEIGAIAEAPSQDRGKAFVRALRGVDSNAKYLFDKEGEVRSGLTPEQEYMAYSIRAAYFGKEATETGEEVISRVVGQTGFGDYPDPSTDPTAADAVSSRKRVVAPFMKKVVTAPVRKPANAARRARTEREASRIGPER